jgi:hypothetical protein
MTISGVEFLQKLLVPVASMRPSAENALRDPWLQSGDSSPIEERRIYELPKPLEIATGSFDLPQAQSRFPVFQLQQLLNPRANLDPSLYPLISPLPPVKSIEEIDAEYANSEGWWIHHST